MIPPSTLEPYLLDPRTWNRWAPAELLSEYAYGTNAAIGIGYAPGPGYFVLQKDEKTGEITLLHTDWDVPVQTDVEPPLKKDYQFAVATAPERLAEGIELSADAMRAYHGVPDDALGRSTSEIITIPVGRPNIALLTFRRTQGNFYKIISLEPIVPAAG